MGDAKKKTLVSPQRGGSRKRWLAAFAILLAASPAVAGPPPIDATIPMGSQDGRSVGPKYCGVGAALAGLYVVLDKKGEYVDSLQGLCVGNRQVQDIFVIGTAPDGGRTGPALSACSEHFVVGARATVSSNGGRMTGMSVICLGGPGTTAASGLFIGRRFARELTTESAIACGPGKLAKGLFGWVDAAGRLIGFTFLCGTQALEPQSSASFVGDWTVTASDGTSFPMTLLSDGGTILGTYDPSSRRGQIQNGTVEGDTLYFNWKLTGTLKASGTGTFHLDDASHLSGTWVWSNGAFRGTWSAVRQ